MRLIPYIIRRTQRQQRSLNGRKTTLPELNTLKPFEPHAKSTQLSEFHRRSREPCHSRRSAWNIRCNGRKTAGDKLCAWPSEASLHIAGLCLCESLWTDRLCVCSAGVGHIVFLYCAPTSLLSASPSAAVVKLQIDVGSRGLCSSDCRRKFASPWRTKRSNCLLD